MCFQEGDTSAWVEQEVRSQLALLPHVLSLRRACQPLVIPGRTHSLLFIPRTQLSLGPPFHPIASHHVLPSSVDTQQDSGLM